MVTVHEEEAITYLNFKNVRSSSELLVLELACCCSKDMLGFAIFCNPGHSRSTSGRGPDLKH